MNSRPKISRELLAEAMSALFEFSPVAFCISTTDEPSYYVQVNSAYLRLFGREWSELEGQPISLHMSGSPDSPSRMRRMHQLATVGFYELEEVDLRHTSGRIVPTLISAHRCVIGGAGVDIEIIVDNTDRKALENAIRQAANTDTLTEVANRAGFERLLARAVESLSGDEAVGLAYIDLNGFKAINDRHGHAVGDAVLRVIGHRLSEAASPGDHVGRIGGDEFAILFTCPNVALPTPQRFEELAAAVCQPILIGGSLFNIGLSMGVAVMEAPRSSDHLLDQADRLMYEAKASGAPIAIRLMHFQAPDDASKAGGSRG
nr:sensor domain-containing diguanylate cyclase [Mesorhizobium sp. BR1-1-16]